MNSNRQWAPQPYDVGSTPEARLFAAILVQAVIDLPRTDKHGASARAYLDDPEVQDLCEALWGVRPCSEIDWIRARPALIAYRQQRGACCRRERRIRIAISRDAGRRLEQLARQVKQTASATLNWLVEQEVRRRGEA